MAFLTDNSGNQLVDSLALGDHLTDGLPISDISYTLMGQICL